MPPRAIISYDDTAVDHDALMLGRTLALAGASLTLGYVRHSTQSDRSREQLEEHDAQALLDRGAQRLDILGVETRVIVSPSTPEGLLRLAELEDANIIVFGSDYRTPSGRVAPQHSTQRLLESSHAAVRSLRLRTARLHIQPKATASAATTPMSCSQSSVRPCGPSK